MAEQASPHPNDPALKRLTAQELYEWRHGVLLRRFSKDKQQIREFQLFVREQIKIPRDVHPEVQALARSIEADPFIRMYLSKMLEEIAPPFDVFKSIEELLQAINYVIGTAPVYKDPDSISWQFPLSALMNFWMGTPSGKVVIRMSTLNDHLNRILKAWCVFLDSAQSLYVMNDGPEGWLCEAAQRFNKLDEYVVPDRSAPHWGWPSYNAFFHRDIKPEFRPVDAPDDQSIINSPNDGVCWALQRDVRRSDKFWLKSQSYSLYDMLHGSKYTERFVGGDVYQTFVNGGADWHRFTAPIAGEVVGAELVPGYAWTESDAVGYDPMSGPYSQGWASGVATRALIFIDSKQAPLGMVCIIPIGLTEVSSLELFVKEGDQVKKGDQLGWFSFGGSSFAMVFQPNAIGEYLVNPPPPKKRNNQPRQTLWANKRFAIARR